MSGPVGQDFPQLSVIPRVAVSMKSHNVIRASFRNACCCAVMRIAVATFLTTRQQKHVNALANDVDIVVAHSWAELLGVLRSHPIRVVIANPAADGQMKVQVVSEIVRRYPSVSVMLYVALDAASFRATVRLCQLGVSHVVLQSFEDSPARLRSTLKQIGFNPLLQYVLRALHPNFQSLPAHLSDVIHDLFAAPHKYATAIDIASKAGISLVQLYRELGRARLTSPKRLIVAAKLLQACRYLHDSDQSIAGVARKVGYSQTRILVQHTLAVFGVPPSVVKRGIHRVTFHRRMVSWLRLPREQLQKPSSAREAVLESAVKLRPTAVKRPRSAYSSRAKRKRGSDTKKVSTLSN